eukprot:TRINITY_DN798_c0_g1_i4.p1 TRINITY_DN798_c0_g1~~TRINITY_DN798_c0_g1_i4.p1  ORF type:complete len:229 (+),score=46.74 TRINITY_DN798_c0_g1_i4:357-1043(+)
MEDLITSAVLLPNSLLCASAGAFLGGWLGFLGCTIDGESHLFFRGAFRGAVALGSAGWKLPDVILYQATHGDSSRQIGGKMEALISRSSLPFPHQQQQLDLPHIQRLSSRLDVIRVQHADEVRKWRDACEFHKRKAEENMLAAAAAGARAAELQSLFELEETLMEKQIQAMVRNRPVRMSLAPPPSPRSRVETVDMERPSAPPMTPRCSSELKAMAGSDGGPDAKSAE